MTNEDITKAIEIVQDSRQTHVAWLDFYKHYPSEEKVHGETCGDTAHHEKCVVGYDHVLRVLSSFL